MLIPILLIVGLFFLYGGGFYFLKEAYSLYKIDRKSYFDYQNQLKILEEKTNSLKKEEKETLLKINQLYEKINTLKEQEDKKVFEYKQNLSQAKKSYFYTIEKEYEAEEQLFLEKYNSLQKEIEQVEKELSVLKNSLSAGMQAQLREQREKEKIDFYRIHLSGTELSDIKKLKEVSTSLSNPLILNKLIWSVYYQKKVSALCNQVLGTDTVCGIYKITNLETKKCYIGQSVSIANRWKTHCKQGCETGATAVNKLYRDIYTEGLHNFSFELLEKCSKEDLNKKEKFWISMYQSDKYGLNSTRGNK